MTIDRARAALGLVHDDPAAAERAAAEILEHADDPACRQVALWARGRARHERGRFSEALRDLNEAAATARTRHDVLGAARIDANRALTEYAIGDVEAAWASLAAAERQLVGGEAGHLHLQRAIIQVHAGDLVDARSSFDISRELLVDADDAPAVLRCLTSRGVACTFLGDYDAAADDLTEAIALAFDLGQRLIAAGAMHNLGYVHACLGETPEALRWFERARDLYQTLDSPERVVAALEQDRAEVLLGAGLIPEAIGAARAAITRHEAAGADTAADDSCLLLAEALLAWGDAGGAHDIASTLAERLTSVSRMPLAARARAVALRARLSEEVSTGPSTPRLGEARATVRALEAAGWREDADRLVVDVGAMLHGQRGMTSWIRELEPVAARRTAGSLVNRIRAWHAEALLRAARGDRGVAMRAVRRGLQAADEQRQTLAGTEVRAAAAIRSSALSVLGVRLAVDSRRAASIFEWSEQTRARSLLATPGDRGADDGVSALLGRLRAARARLAAAPTDVAARREVSSLEVAVRDREHQRPAESRGQRDPRYVPVSLPSLRAALGDATLVSFVEVDGRLWSLAVSSGPMRRADLGPVIEFSDVLERLGHALARLVRGGSSAGLRSAMASFDHDRRVLESLLGTDRLPAGDLVVVPSPALVTAPWSALPGLKGRSVTVAPSATLWARPWSTTVTGEPVFVAGPGLPGALAEVVASGAADVLTGSDATIAAVVEAFANRRLVHVAAHGTFRADAPLFSGLDLADGRLTLSDLRDLPAVPELVVLPACHLAASRPLGGGEALGAIAVLLGRGVRTVVAPLQAVADAPAAELMTSFHQLLRTRAPAAALAETIAPALDAPDPAVVATAASFVCSGRR